MVRKSRCMSGSLDRPRGHSRLLQPPKLPLLSLSPRPPNVFSVYQVTFPAKSSASSLLFGSLSFYSAKMGAIPEADPDEPQVTKPFKFVTGKLAPCRALQSILLPSPPLFVFSAQWAFD